MCLADLAIQRPRCHPWHVERDDPRILTPNECVDLLTTARIGRIALSEHCLPTIVPVLYEIDPTASTISLHAISGLLAQAAVRGDIVCFGTDFADQPDNELWSVVVVGKLETLMPAFDHQADPPSQFGSTKVSLPLTIVAGRATTNVVARNAHGGKTKNRALR